MSETVKIPAMRPEPERDRWGRYRLPALDGSGTRSWTRATTVVGALKDLNGLIGWKRRKVAEGLALRPELLAGVSDLAAQIEAAADWRDAKDAKAAFDELCDQAAHEAGADRGSEAGTQAHTLTEYADAGRLDEVRHLATEAELADLGAYLDACDAAQIERPAEWIERVVVCSVTDSAGTLDRIVVMPDGRVLIADVKSQASVDFGWMEIACQLAQYANADGMVNLETGRLEPLPADLDKTTGLVMHVPVGKATCDLYEIDLVAGWEAALTAAEVRRHRSRSKVMGWPYTPRRSVDNTSVDQDLYLIRTASHPDALVALWRDLSARGRWTELHTQEAAARKARLLAPTAS
jgi:hypothetical protein